VLAGHFDTIGRYLGLGWGEGYHANNQCYGGYGYEHYGPSSRSPGGWSQNPHLPPTSPLARDSAGLRHGNSAPPMQLQSRQSVDWNR
jgi:hypothetical protein